MEEHSLELVDSVYFVPDDLDKLSGIWPVRYGRNLAKPSYKSGPRIIPYYSLHFVRSGSVELRCERLRVRLNKGDAFCLFPTLAYSYRIVQDGEPLAMEWVAFDGAQAAELLASIPITPERPYARQVFTKQAELLLQRMWKNGNNRSRPARWTCYSLLYRLFSQLASGEEQASPTRGPEDWIQDSLDYMHTHYTEQIRIQDVARHIGINRTYFSELFTRYVGVTPVQHLQRLRLEEAVRLLGKRAANISEIGLSLGYADAASFTRAFRNYYGKPPSTYLRAATARKGEEEDEG